MNTRGIVITPRFDFDGQTLHFPGLVGIDSISLREYLLYWDKIDFPDNNVISIGSSSDVQFLMNAGVLTRTDVRLVNFRENIGYCYIYAQVEALRIKSRDEPGQWSLAQAGNYLFIPPELSRETRSIEIELYNVLPVPSEDVSLEDILKFKERRRSELLAFRMFMDELYIEVIASGDIPRAKSAALNRLEVSLQDLNKAVNEYWISKWMSSLKVELNIPNIITHAIAGGTMSVAFGISPAVGAAIGAASAAIKFDLPVMRKADGLPAELKDFAYLHRIEKELNT